MARLRYTLKQDNFLKKELNALKQAFKKEGWDTDFIKSVSLSDADLIGYNIAECPNFSEESGAYDWVEENGNTVLPANKVPICVFNKDITIRPSSKIVTFLSRSVKVSYFHDGGVCSVVLLTK